MFLPLTNDRGERVYMNMMLVECIMPFDAARFESHESSCRSQLICGKGDYFRVRETVEEIHSLIERARTGPPVN
jgi:hypothetical protein